MVSSQVESFKSVQREDHGWDGSCIVKHTQNHTHTQKKAKPASITYKFSACKRKTEIMNETFSPMIPLMLLSRRYSCVTLPSWSQWTSCQLATIDSPFHPFDLFHSFPPSE